MDESQMLVDYCKWSDETKPDAMSGSWKAWREATRRANKLNADRINTLEAVLTEIALYAHDNSTGPAVPDHLWEIRRIAYDVL